MPKWDFSNQVAIITGGAGGLGIALAESLIRSGAKVYACDNHEGHISEARQALASVLPAGSSAFTLDRIDVCDTAALRRWIRAIGDKEETVDILVNAAGICAMTKFAEVTEEQWDRVVDVNLKATFFATQTAVPYMQRNGYGRIINISSVGAYTGGAIATPPYCAAKAGVVALMKSFANSLSPSGITVNTVAPGPFDTEMIADFPEETMRRLVELTPCRRIGQPQDVVDAVLFLADPSNVHMTGATLDVNGGLYFRA